MTPRWEYRVWGDDLGELRATAVAIVESLAVRISRETYLVGFPETNAKIRDGVLDVKRLIQTKQGFQLWTPVTKESFPLAATAANDVLAMVAPPNPPPPKVSSFEILSFLAHARDVEVIVADVAKRRETYRLGACLLEFADVTINGFTRHTMAVESEGLSAAIELTARLGISALPNQSYPIAIRHTLRM